MKLQKHKETIAIIQFLVQSRWETTVVDVVGDQKVRGGKKASSSSSQTSFSPPSVNNTKLFSSVVVDTFSKLKRQVIKKKKIIYLDAVTQWGYSNQIQAALCLGGLRRIFV